MVKRKDRTGRRQVLQLNEEQSRPYLQQTKSVSQGPAPLVTSYDDSDASDSEDTKRKKPAESGNNGLVVKDAIDEQLADFLKEIDAISSVPQVEAVKADDDGQAGGSGSGLLIDPVPPPPPPEPVAESDEQEPNNEGAESSESSRVEPTCVWVECMDDTTGYIYYWNQVTNEVTWERPPEYEAYLALFAQYQEEVAAATTSEAGTGGGVVLDGGVGNSVDNGAGSVDLGGCVGGGDSTNVGSLGVYGGAVATSIGSEIPETGRSTRDAVPSKKRKVEPEIGKIIPITSYGSSDGSSSEESDGGSSTSPVKTGRLSKRQRGLSSAKATKPGRSSPVAQAVIGPQLPETLIGPQLPEVVIGPQLPEVMIGPQLPEPMIGPQLPEPVIGPQLPGVMIGPQLPEEMIGPQLPVCVIGPQLPDATIGPQMPEAEIGPQPLGKVIGPQLLEGIIGPQLPEGMIGPQLPEAVIGPQLPCADGALSEPPVMHSTPHEDDGPVLSVSQLDRVGAELTTSVPGCVSPITDSVLESQELPDSLTPAEGTQSPDASASSALAALVDYPGSPGLEEGEIVDEEEETAAVDPCATERPAPGAYPVMVGAKLQFGAAEETVREESSAVPLDSELGSTTKCDKRRSVSPRTSKTSRKLRSVKEAKGTSRHLVSYGDSESNDEEDSDASGAAVPSPQRRDSAVASASSSPTASRDETGRPGHSRSRQGSPARSTAGSRKSVFAKIAFVRSDEVLVLSECGKSADVRVSEEGRRTPEVEAAERRSARGGVESSAESEEVDDFDDVERALDRALMESKKKEATVKTQEKGESPSESAEMHDDTSTEQLVDDSTTPTLLNGHGHAEAVGSLPTCSATVAATETGKESKKTERKTAEPSVDGNRSLAASSTVQAADIQRAHGLLMDQLGLLDEGLDQRSSLIDLLVQTRTRMEDFRAGALDPDYLLLKLHETRLAVTRLQKAATLEPPLPLGWQRHWDRECRRRASCGGVVAVVVSASWLGLCRR